MNLDTAFIAQIITIIGFSVGACVLLASIGYPRHIRRSLRAYAWGKILMGIAFLLAAKRGDLVPELLVPAANGIAIAGLSLNYTAIRHLQQKPVPRHLALGCGVAMGLACALLLLLGPADLSRIRLLSSLVAVVVLLLVAAEFLLSYEGRGMAHYMSGALTLVMAGAYMIRIGAALTQPAPPIDTLIDDGTERAVFVMSFLGTVVGTINFILVASDEFNKELTTLANTDGLTGVLNRRRFLEIGEAEFRRARRQDRPLTVLILDIDRFKTINDRGGHPHGDRVIRAVADCCAAQIRREDSIGRMGGEEFAILLPDTPREAGERAAERLRAAIEQDVAPLGVPLGLAVTCSVGGVARDNGHQDFSDLIAASDKALYAAKRDGRNRVRFAGWSGAAELAESLPAIV